MITYTLLFSLTVTSFLSMVVTRFIADMLYEEKIRYGIAFFLGLYRDHAGGRRDPVWNFPYLFRSRTSGRIAVSVAFWRADRYLECNELSHCNQRLQRNHAVIYSCYCDHIYIRLGIADGWEFPMWKLF